MNTYGAGASFSVLERTGTRASGNVSNTCAYSCSGKSKDSGVSGVSGGIGGIGGMRLFCFGMAAVGLWRSSRRGKRPEQHEQGARKKN